MNLSLTTSPHTDLDTYAQTVATGLIPVGKYHRLACARHLRDRAREGTAAFPFCFVPEKAERFFRFAHKLRHYKAEWAGQFIVLQPHQRFRLGSLFAWVHVETGLRRFRVSYNELPRKNGKSLEAALVALYLTFFDHEPGAEGYCIATKRDQAKIVFNDCKRLVRASGLRSRIAVLMANLHREATASKLEPLGADRDSTDGLNPSLVILDEAHAMKHRGMIDVMETATGSRLQPVINWITTAGNNPVSPCGDQHDYACKVLEGILVDETLFAFIAHADPEDDWTLESTWRKANPNYGVSVKPDDIRALAQKAAHITSAQNAFKQKRLNIWVNTIQPWLSMDGWARGQCAAAPAARLEQRLGRKCAIGIDMSSKIDLTAVVAMFPPEVEGGTWALLAWCLTPLATLADRARRDRAPYDQWVTDGYLHTNPGNRIDQRRVIEVVEDWLDAFDVQGIGIDPWNAGNLVTELGEFGVPVVEVPQTIPQMSAPSKEFEADVLDGLIDAGADPLVQWCASNAVAPGDNKGNIFPAKKQSRGRIDPIVAAIIGRKIAALDLSEPPADDPDLVVAA
jgi:phage terminase large subunit-like protein